MAVDMFLKLDGIKGESKAEGHKDEIDVLSYSWGLSQTGTFAAGGGAGTGKAQFQDFHFTKKTDKSSPLLFVGCATGEHIKSGIVTVRKSGFTGGKDDNDFLKITLSDCLVTSYQNSGSSGGDVPTDQFSLNYAKIEFTYMTQDPDGSAGETITRGWDLKANKRV